LSLAFLPYGRQCIEDDDVAAVVEALRSDYLTTGPWVERFEAALAQRCGAAHAVAVSNGTAALHAAYHAAGLGPGDEVVVPAITFLATANAALYLGAEPVFADVCPDTGLVQPEQLAAAAGERCRALAPVHLTGCPVALEPIAALARRRGLLVVEDAAHALGASYQGRPIGDGHWSDLAILSFHPVKHVTTGEGGAVLCRDPELAHRLRRFRNHGMERDPARLESPSPGPWYYEQQVLGHNLRITDLQCALGVSQLAKLERFVQRRRALAGLYDRLLQGMPGLRPLPSGPAGADSSYHLYSVLIEFAELGIDRASVMRSLAALGVGSQVHYLPLPLQPFYQRRGWRIEDFPGAQRYYERTLSLPLYPDLRDADVERVVEALHRVIVQGWRAE